jgi:hypothetical protein
MDDNNIGIIDVSYIDSQSELLVDLINKSKTEKEKIEYAKDTLNAVATKYLINGVIANSRNDNKLTYIDQEYNPIRFIEVQKANDGKEYEGINPGVSG